MDRITVAIDGHAEQHPAFEWLLARPAPRAFVLRIVTVGPLGGRVPAQLTTLLADCAEHARARLPECPVETEVLPGEEAIPAALAVSSSRGHLLVIGRHRTRPVRSALAGWLPLEIAAAAACPVVVVPDDVTRTEGDIVVGLQADGSAREALEFAETEAARTRSRLLIVGIERPGGTLEQARLLDDAVAEARHRHHTLEVEAVAAEGDPADALVARAAEAALIVVGRHEGSALDHVVAGSVSYDVMKRSAVPVCVVPPR